MAPETARVILALVGAQVLLGGYVNSRTRTDTVPLKGHIEPKTDNSKLAGLLGVYSYTVIGKFGIKAIHPIWFALLREVSAAPILLVLAYLFEYLPSKNAKDTASDGASAPRSMPQWSDWPLFFLIGVTGVYGNQLFFILGLSISSSITAAVIQPIAPIWTAIFAISLKMEAVTTYKVAGIGISVLGSLVTLGFFTHSANSFGTGSVFFLLNTACMGAYFLLQKPLLKRFPPFTVTAISYIIGASMMSVTTFVYYLTGHLPPLSVEALGNALPAILYAIFGTSIGAYLLVAYANTRIDSTIVSAGKTLQPLSASILAYFLLGERLLIHHAIGAIFLLTGMGILLADVQISPVAVKERTT